MNHTELLLQNCHNLSFEAEQITSLCCDQRTWVNRFVVLRDETK